MRGKKMLLMMFLLAAIPMFAQTPGGGSGIGAGELKLLGAVVGMGIASGLCGIGMGRAIASSAEATARNPGARGPVFLTMIIGLALIESLAIYTLLIAFKATS